MIHRVINMAVEQSGIILATDHMEVLRIMGYRTMSHAIASYTGPDMNPHLNVEYIAINHSLGPISDDFLLSAFFHEVSHATGSGNRLNRIGITNAHARSDRMVVIKEELIANHSALSLLEALGLDSAEASTHLNTHIKIMLAYVSPDNVEGMMTQVKIEAEKAKEYILQNWLVGIEIADQKAA